MISAINLPLSPISLFSTYAVCRGEIRLGRTFSGLDTRALEIILQSTFNKEIGRQFLINLLSLSFFSINSITGCLCEVLSFFLSFAVRHLLYLPLKLQKTLFLLVHRSQVSYYFAYSSRRYTILFPTACRRIH